MGHYSLGGKGDADREGRRRDKAVTDMQDCVVLGMRHAEVYCG
jgi:hypothetical protein